MYPLYCIQNNNLFHVTFNLQLRCNLRSINKGTEVWLYGSLLRQKYVETTFQRGTVCTQTAKLRLSQSH